MIQYSLSNWSFTVIWIKHCLQKRNQCKNPLLKMWGIESRFTESTVNIVSIHNENRQISTILGAQRQTCSNSQPAPSPKSRKLTASDNSSSSRQYLCQFIKTDKHAYWFWIYKNQVNNKRADFIKCESGIVQTLERLNFKPCRCSVLAIHTLLQHKCRDGKCSLRASAE